jgi:SAM-dependent methyltransferase
MLKKIFYCLKNNGLFKTFKSSYLYFFYDYIFDFIHKTKTLKKELIEYSYEATGEISGITRYAPCCRYKLMKLIKLLPIDTKKSIFLDLGSGKGLALFTASQFFKKVCGVEIIKKFYEDSLQNLEKIKYKNIEIYFDDATNFNISKEVNVIFLSNPCYKNMMEKIIKNILKSYNENKRDIYIIYYSLNYTCIDIMSENFKIIHKEYFNSKENPEAIIYKVK